MGRTLESGSKNYYLRGYYVNIDKVFEENPWCSFIIIDDCSLNGGLIIEKMKPLNYFVAHRVCGYEKFKTIK